ncbi:MAG: sulfatase-like hydrolase/transferase [Chloroflexi bacterium]|nr:sulfatase-like hydrolase/transferase [Chloroflexota bacterium]
MGSNDYCTRPWHLPEHCHQTNWTVREMSKFIARRDPTRPAFWYMSFSAPHPPLVPLAEYMDMYRHLEVDMPFMGDWTRDVESMPYALRHRRLGIGSYTDTEVRLARQAFYAMCTHVDHQIRLVIGLLREEGLLDETIVMFTADHGEMLGNHGQFAKDIFYEDSAKIPMILMPQADRKDIGQGVRDGRLAAQADVFPTLLDLCGIPIPDAVEGLSLVGERRHDVLYGEHWEDIHASRMIRDRRHKLIYYPVGNRTQLFDLESDPDELRDLAGDPAHRDVVEHLTRSLVGRLYGSDLRWLEGDRLVGLPEEEYTSVRPPDRGLGGQRGLRFR